MRNFIIYLVLLVCLFATKMAAQKSFEDRAKEIAKNIEWASREEKALLKSNVEDVNVQLEKGLITKEAADKQKLDLANATALAIEKRVGEEQAKLNALVQDKVNGVVKMNKENRFSLTFHDSKSDSINKKTQGERRTTSQFVFAVGVNNVVTDGNVSNSDFRFWGSRFYELGLTTNYRLLQNSNLLHLKYGFSFMFNNLRPTNNSVFVVNGNQTNLETVAPALTNSRFRNVYLVLPMHFEFDFTKNKSHNGKPYFDSHKGARLGIGGYIGTNLGTRQRLKSEANDYETRANTSGDFNTTNFIYGTSAYIGYKETSLYVKYDLNNLFTNNVVTQNNISFGIRFDFN